MAVRMAAIHLGKLRRITLLQASGAGAGGRQGRRASSGNRRPRCLRQARSLALEELDEVQDSVHAADIACKTTGMPEALIAERLALAIAGRARRLGL